MKLYGENLYGEHSIHYEDLKHIFTFLLQGIMRIGIVGMMPDLVADILSLPTVPVIFKGKLGE